MELKTAFRVYQAVAIAGAAMFVWAVGMIAGLPLAVGIAGALLIGAGLVGSYLAHMARYHR